MSVSIAKFMLNILLFAALIDLAKQNCFKIRLLKIKMTDTENFKWNATVYSNNTVSIDYRVLKAVPTLIWSGQLTQSAEGYEKVLYKTEKMKACELIRFVKSVKILRGTLASLLGPDKGNLSLTCPMPAGTYVMRNLFITPGSRIMRFLYVPNSILTLKGGSFSSLPNNKMQKLGTYEINGTMTRMC